MLRSGGRGPIGRGYLPSDQNPVALSVPRGIRRASAARPGERVRANDERATSPGDVLRELFNAHWSCLVLIDEGLRGVLVWPAVEFLDDVVKQGHALVFAARDTPIQTNRGWPAAPVPRCQHCASPGTRDLAFHHAV